MSTKDSTTPDKNEKVSSISKQNSPAKKGSPRKSKEDEIDVEIPAEIEPRLKLRVITYLSPGVPVEIFVGLCDYLERQLGCETFLIYESRWSGPPVTRQDPFTSNDVDLGFMCSTAYLAAKGRNKYMELCPVGALHSHPQANGDPVYFSDVIIHKNNRERFRDFHSLKGCRWAYNEEISLSGNIVVLSELKKLGFNSNFFGNTACTGSHHNSIRQILDGRADATAIDSNVLAGYVKQHPESASQLHSVLSLGPMPIYPVILNKRLPGELKAQITKAFLDLNKNAEFGQRMMQLGLLGYTEIDDSFYNMEAAIKATVKAMSIRSTYY